MLKAHQKRQHRDPRTQVVMYPTTGKIESEAHKVDLKTTQKGNLDNLGPGTPCSLSSDLVLSDSFRSPPPGAAKKDNLKRVTVAQLPSDPGKRDPSGLIPC